MRRDVKLLMEVINKCNLVFLAVPDILLRRLHDLQDLCNHKSKDGVRCSECGKILHDQ